MDCQVQNLKDVPDLRRFYFSHLRKVPVRVAGGGANFGRLEDIVVGFKGPDFHAVGLLIGQTQNGPDQFVPWDRVVDLFGIGIIIRAPDEARYPPFQPHSGLIQANLQLIGRKFGIFEDKIVGTTNDLILGFTGNILFLEAVDTSLRGPLRKWGLGKLAVLVKEKQLPWDRVFPFLQPPLGVD